MTTMKNISSDFQPFDKTGRVRGDFTDKELSALSPDRRARLHALVAAANDVEKTEAMISATQRSFAESDQMLAVVKADLKAKAPTPIDCARAWMDSTRGM
jgi:hypothetical protein